jgi:hypothetical protein
MGMILIFIIIYLSPFSDADGNNFRISSFIISVVETELEPVYEVSALAPGQTKVVC